MRPAFVISLDEELIWGSFDHTPEDRWSAENPDPRGVVRDLLGLFEEYEIPCTWAVVGHLFLRSCERGTDGRAHPELARPSFPWHQGDWFAGDPCSDRQRAPLWYGDDLLDWILDARVGHEIGCHSFSHVVYGDPGCGAEVARDDIKACLEAARSRGVTLRSFVFPRNVEGHHGLLAEHGFSAYRGEDPAWFRPLPSRPKRIAHLADQLLGITPPVSSPHERLPGLWNIPGSMIFLPRNGVRRFVPLATRVRKAHAGLARAVAEQRVFHLWFHPFNFSADRIAMLRAFGSVLRRAAELRDRGFLDISTMGQLALQLSARGRTRTHLATA